MKSICVRHSVPTESHVTISIDGGEFDSATIRGPFCSNAKTLPSTTEFKFCESNATADLIDPLFWSSQNPAYYRVRLGCSHHETDFKFAIRKLEVARRSFYSNGKRWVLRGIRIAGGSQQTIDALKTQNLSGVLASPDETILEHATEIGVPLVCHIPIHSNLDEELRRLSSWPCVLFFLIENDDTLDLREFAPNALLIRSIHAQQQLQIPTPWQHALAVSCEDLQKWECSATLRFPIVATRYTGEINRLHCDRLQRDLAPQFNLAGYLT